MIPFFNTTILAVAFLYPSTQYCPPMVRMIRLEHTISEEKKSLLSIDEPNLFVFFLVSISVYAAGKNCSNLVNIFK